MRKAGVIGGCVASVMLALVIVAPGVGVEPPADSAVGPNFVIVVTDDQRWDSIGRCIAGFDGTDLAAGPNACMPHLQRHLVATGTTFLRGYVTSSLCCPARASILTGQYSRHHGVRDNSSWARLQDVSTLATWLRDAGYRTGLIGKYLNGYGDPASTPPGYVPPGWDSWHAYWHLNSSVIYRNFTLIEKEGDAAPALIRYGNPPTSHAACADGNYYSTDLFCNKALSFLAGDRTRPFFLYLAPGAVHAPVGVPPRYNSWVSSLTLPRYPIYNAVPSPSPPSFLPVDPLPSSTLNSNDTTFRRMLGAARAVDDSIDAIHSLLAADGRLANTVFVFTSDHGIARSEHRWSDKQCQYEICHRVPFVVACPPAVCPGGVPGSTDSDHFALNIDIPVTIAELAGIVPRLRLDGASLVPLLTNGDETTWRTSFILDDEFRVTNAPLGLMSVREDGHVYKFVRFLRASSDFELYDLSADPWEMKNLAFDEAHASTRSAMASALAALITAPSLSTLSGPSGTVTATDATFKWTSSEPAQFECSLDTGAFSRCGSGTSGSTSFSGLEPGSHTFSVRGIDSDNNVSRVRSRTWTIAGPTPSPTPS